MVNESSTGDAPPISPSAAALSAFRQAEADAVRRWVPPHSRLLDVGAGNGFQARTFADWGCTVSAIDVDVDDTARRYWSVRSFDGVNIPFPADSFDVVFSSNVMEHVTHPDLLLAEMARVLAPSGHVVHVVPSASWRFWTSVTRYVNAARRLVSSPAATSHIDAHHAHESTAASTRRRGGWSDVLLGPPHGEFSSTAAELVAYRRHAWIERFRTGGFELVDVSTNQLFYTGYTLLPNLPLSVRRGLAHILGASCHVFVLKPASVSRRAKL
jgi:SAM-dependent methyltransferase